MYCLVMGFIVKKMLFTKLGNRYCYVKGNKGINVRQSQLATPLKAVLPNRRLK